MKKSVVLVLITVNLLAAIFLVWFFSPLIYTNREFHQGTDFLVLDDMNRKSKVEVDVSIVIPAFNEEKRMKQMLDATFDYFHAWSLAQNKTFEVILVDDGSTDRTLVLGLKYQKQDIQSTRVINIIRNVGKAGAVRIGVDLAVGKYILMVDADGATDINDFESLYTSLQSTSFTRLCSFVVVLKLFLPFFFCFYSESIAIGSRAHLAGKSVATRSLFRTILMKGFHLFVTVFCTSKIQDTQCGFKLFSAGAAKTLFSNLHLYGWAFDIELIFMAERLNIPMHEIAVNWKEVEGSKLIRNKLDIITTSATMARDIVCVWLAYSLGIWKLPSKIIAKNTQDEL